MFSMRVVTDEVISRAVDIIGSEEQGYMQAGREL